MLGRCTQSTARQRPPISLRTTGHGWHPTSPGTSAFKSSERPSLNLTAQHRPVPLPDGHPHVPVAEDVASGTLAYLVAERGEVTSHSRRTAGHAWRFAGGSGEHAV